MRFAASLVGPDKASDLVSEVMVATLQQRDLVSLENPKAYLMQGVLNRARSAARAVARERKAFSRLTAQGRYREDAPEVLLNEHVFDAVRNLPVQQRAAIYLVYWEDLGPSDAAELLGIRPATLRRYLFLARQKLRMWIDE